MGPYNTIALVEAEAARRVATISTTDHRQALAAALDLDWTESFIPLTAQADSALAQHLVYSCSIEDAPVRQTSNEPGDSVLVDALLVVGFWYRIRPGAKMSDYRLASEAARLVLGVLCAEWPGVDITPANAWKPGRLVNEWLPVVLTFTASFQINVTPTAAP